MFPRAASTQQLDKPGVEGLACQVFQDSIWCKLVQPDRNTTLSGRDGNMLAGKEV